LYFYPLYIYTMITLNGKSMEQIAKQVAKRRRKELKDVILNYCDLPPRKLYYFIEAIEERIENER